MKIFSALTLLLLPWSAAAADKPNLSGTWRLDGEAQLPDGVPSAIKIVQNGSDFRLTNASAKTNEDSIIQCDTVGKQCEAKLDGNPVKVSYWYNGPVLVEMLYVGKDNDRIIKTRRALSEDGQKMTVEVIQIVPQGKAPVKAVFLRQHEEGG